MRSLSLSWSADTELPVSVALVKDQLRISHTEFDDLITTLHIPAAVQWAEGFMHRSILAKTHTWVLQDFPQTADQAILLPRGKVQSVASIVYTSGGTQTTLRGPTSGSPIGTDYRENLMDESCGMIYPIDNWPTVDTSVPQPVVITYSAGWTSTQVPADIKAALCRFVADQLDVPGVQDMGNMQVWQWEAKEAAIASWRIVWR